MPMDSTPAAFVRVGSEALAACQILDTPAEGVFDDLARRAAEALATPMATISFFDPGNGGSKPWREWFKARVGFPEAALPFHESFFPPLAAGRSDRERVHVMNDALADKRFREHRLVTGAPHICFYAAAAIYSQDQHVIGALAVFDTSSRDVLANDLSVLANLADLVGARLIARTEARRDRRPENLSAAIPPSTSDLRAEIARLERRLEDEIASRQATESQLRDEKEFSDVTIDSMPDTLYVFSKSGRMVRWNRNFPRSTGYTEAEISNMRAIDFVVESDQSLVREAHRRLFEHGEEVSLEATMRAKTGETAPYSFYGRPLDIAGYRFCLGIGRDITRRREDARLAAEAKERLDLALVGSSLALWDWDLTTNQVYFSPDWTQILGVQSVAAGQTVFPGAEVLAWNHRDDQERFASALLAAVKDQARDFSVEYRVRDLKGEWVWMESNGKVTERDPAEKGGRARRMTGTTANIAKRKAAEERVEYLATRDTLTGLPNRMLLNDRLEIGVANAARKQSQLAFMFIDLDRFKTINDSLGHDIGDELLKRVAARLTACVRATDTVARLGGDEFAVILENVSQADTTSAQTIAQKMIASLASPIMIETHHLNTSCSIGISLFPADGGDPKTLMKHADVAMYDAKSKGRNNYQFFSHHLNQRAQERLAIENYLRLALRRNELLLHYQPRVRFRDGAIVGVEALLRWQHPRHGLMLPARFLSVAEDSGLSVPIGEWVIEQATAQVARWRRSGLPDLHLAINLSPAQLFDSRRLVTALEAATRAGGFAAGALELELTESMLQKNADETSALLKRLGAIGVRIAIDDFGTGYSSLSYLKDLPVNAIKVDSSFVRELSAGGQDSGIIRAIIAMTHSLKLQVVAEGVETAEQHRILQGLGCDEFQGFYFAPALSVADFTARYLPQ